MRAPSSGVVSSTTSAGLGHGPPCPRPGADPEILVPSPALGPTTDRPMSPARPEPLHPHVSRRAAQLDQQAAGELGEPGRPADEGASRPADHQRRELVGGQRPAGRSRRRVRDSAMTRRPRRSSSGYGRSARVRAATASRSSLRPPSPRRAAASPPTAPRPLPPATPTAGGRAVPDEPAADRAAHLQFVARLDDVGQVPGDLAVVQPLDPQFDQRIGGRGRHRVGPVRDVAVVGASTGPRSAGRAGGRPGRAPRAAARTDARGGMAPRHRRRRPPPVGAGPPGWIGVAPLSHPGTSARARGRRGRGSRCAPRTPARRGPSG